MNDTGIIEIINKKLSNTFTDYNGMYFFGSRLNQDVAEYDGNSDYDVVLIFESLDYSKQLKIAGVISELEYDLNICIDCKLLTTSGVKSVEYIREKINPYFIMNAVDNGIYYARV